MKIKYSKNKYWYKLYQKIPFLNFGWRNIINYYKWKKFFAWYPIFITSGTMGVDIYDINYGDETDLVWFEWVLRRGPFILEKKDQWPNCFRGTFEYTPLLTPEEKVFGYKYKNKHLFFRNKKRVTMWKENIRVNRRIRFNGKQKIMDSLVDDYETYKIKNAQECLDNPFLWVKNYKETMSNKPIKPLSEGGGLKENE